MKAKSGRCILCGSARTKTRINTVGPECVDVGRCISRAMFRPLTAAAEADLYGSGRSGRPKGQQR